MQHFNLYNNSFCWPYFFLTHVWLLVGFDSLKIMIVLASLVCVCVCFLFLSLHLKLYLVWWVNKCKLCFTVHKTSLTMASLGYSSMFLVIVLIKNHKTIMFAREFCFSSKILKMLLSRTFKDTSWEIPEHFIILTNPTAMSLMGWMTLRSI